MNITKNTLNVIIRSAVLLISLSAILLTFGCTESDISVPVTDDTALTEEITTNPPDYSQMQVIAEGKVLSTELGMRAATYENSSPYTVQVKIQPNGVLLYGYEEGSAVIELTDYFGHTAKVIATVEAGNNVITTIVEECTDDFIEVGQFNAIGNGYKDDTKAFQDAIDSAKPGETVYVYPGRYNITTISMREGVTLKLYTEMTDAKEGYSDRIAADVNAEKYAILSGAAILNTDNGAKGSTAVSNFSIIGGVIDINLKGKGTIIFACGENIRMENVIFKDISGVHIIQIMGCKNTVIENCMFAGFKCSSTTSQETIQIEPSRPNATGGPITFEEGEVFYSENITINNCYFGKSDEAGPHLIAIGDHCAAGGPTVKNFKITNNYFDECIYAAIRYNNLSDVEISGNTFISSPEYKNTTTYSSTVPASFIILYCSNSKYTYTASNGKTITEVASNEQSGIHDMRIVKNTFIVKEGADKRILYFASNYSAPGATYLTDIYRQDKYDSPIYMFSGYSANTNFVEGIVFSENTITFKGQPSYFNYFVYLKNVYDLTYENNTLNLENGAFFSYDNQGQHLISVSTEDELVYEIKTEKTSKTITIKVGNDSYVVSASFVGNVKIEKGVGGKINVSSDANGNLTVNVIPSSGYTVEPITLSSGKLLFTNEINGLSRSSTIFIYFKNS